MVFRTPHICSLILIHIALPSGVDINTIKGKITRQDHAILVHPNKSSSSLASSKEYNSEDDDRPDPYDEKDKTESKEEGHATYDGAAPPLEPENNNADVKEKTKLIYIDRDKVTSIMNKTLVEQFKSDHPKDKFIPVPEKDVMIMNKKQIENLFSTESPKVMLLDDKNLHKFQKEHSKDTFITIENDPHLFPPLKYQAVSIGKLKKIRIKKPTTKLKLKVMNKDDLETFKTDHANDKFIESRAKDIKIMNANQLVMFKKNHPNYNLIYASQEKKGHPNDNLIKVINPTSTLKYEMMNKDDLDLFKKDHSNDKFIESRNKNIKIMDANQLEMFKKNHPNDKLIDATQENKINPNDKVKNPTTKFESKVMNKHALEAFKKDHANDKFIESRDKDIKIMNANQLKMFKKNHPNDNLIYASQEKKGHPNDNLIKVINPTSTLKYEVMNKDDLNLFKKDHSNDKFIESRDKNIKIMDANQLEMFTKNHPNDKLIDATQENKIIPNDKAKNPTTKFESKVMNKHALEAFMKDHTNDKFIKPRDKDIKIMGSVELETFKKNHPKDNFIKIKNPTTKLESKVMNKVDLKTFKKDHANDKFIESRDEDIQTMDKNELEMFKKNNADANIIGLKSKIDNKKDEMNEDSKTDANEISGSTIGIMTKNRLKKFKKEHKADRFIQAEDNSVKIMNKNELANFKKNNPNSNFIESISKEQQIMTNYGIMTKDQLEIFKKEHKTDKFIQAKDKSIKVMNEGELDNFKKKNPNSNFIGSVSNKQTIEAFKRNQANFIDTLIQMLVEGNIDGVTKEQLSEFQEYQNTSINSLIKLNAGKELDKKTKERLKEFKSHLIRILNTIEEGNIDRKIKHSLEDFKKIHAHFIDIIGQMHSGNAIATKTILELKKRQDNLVLSIEKPKMNEKQAERQMRKIRAFKRNQANFIDTLKQMIVEGNINTDTKQQLDEFQEYQDTSVNALIKLTAGEELDKKTKERLKEFKSHLIKILNKIEEGNIEKKIKQNLEDFKEIHAYFIDIIGQMHSGNDIATKTILELEKRQDNLVSSIDEPKMIEKEQLLTYKEQSQSFIDTLKLMEEVGSIDEPTKKHLRKCKRAQQDFNKLLKKIQTEGMNTLSKDELKDFTKDQAIIIEAIDNLQLEGKLDQLKKDKLKKFKSYHENFVGTFIKKQAERQMQKIGAFKTNQASFIETLNQMLVDGNINGVTKVQLDEFQEYQGTSVNALIKLTAGEELDNKTKERLQEFKSHLIKILNKIEEGNIAKTIKHNLEDFKKIHAHFIDIIGQMHSGNDIDTKTILELEKRQDNLVSSIDNHMVIDGQIKSSDHNSITALNQIKEMVEELRDNIASYIDSLNESGRGTKIKGKCFCSKKESEPVGGNCTSKDSSDQLISYRVLEDSKSISPGKYEDLEVIGKFVKENIEMGTSETMPSVIFEVVLPGEFFLEKFLLANIEENVKLDIPLSLDYLKTVANNLEGLTTNKEDLEKVKTILNWKDFQ